MSDSRKRSAESDAPRADKRTNNGDERRQALQKLADAMPKAFSLRELPRGTILFRGSTSEWEAQQAAPAPYAFYSGSVGHARQYACSLHGGDGAHPMLRKYRVVRPVYLLNLDTTTYRETYDEQDLAWLARKHRDRDPIEREIDDPFTVRLQSMLDSLNERIGEAVKCTELPRSPDAFNWLCASEHDSDDALCGVDEPTILELLKHHLPGVGGYVRNENAAGVCEYVVADPTALKLLAVRKLSTDEAEQLSASLSTLHDCSDTKDWTEHIENDVPHADATVSDWMACKDRRYQLIESVESDVGDLLCWFQQASMLASTEVHSFDVDDEIGGDNDKRWEQLSDDDDQSSEEDNPFWPPL